MKSLLSLAIAVALAQSAFAADESPKTQPTVTVTAVRVERPVDDTLASISVITRADIEASMAPTLIELLRSVPGVDLSRNGGVGSATSILLRGSRGAHTLVLIDGVRVSSVNSSVYDYAHLPLEQIERIEIVRGPRAAYWGSDAIGGVIQIFTRKPDGAAVDLAGSRYNTLDGSASYGRAVGDGAFGATVGGVRSRGFSATNPFSPSFDRDNDGYVNRNASINGRYDVAGQHFAVRAIGSNDDVDFDQGHTEVRQHALMGSWAGNFSDDWSHQLTFGHEFETLSTAAFFNRLSSQRNAFDWIHHLRLSDDQSLAFGVNYQRDHGLSADPSSGIEDFNDTRNNGGGFVSLSGGHQGWDYDVAARYDHFQGFGGKATGQGAIGYRFDNETRVFASVGQGYRAPDLNELFYPGFFGAFGGNPDLDPETSFSQEIGVEFPLAAGHKVSINAYHTRVHDLIAFQGENNNAINIGGTTLEGVEIAYHGQWQRWQLDANASFQHTRDDQSGQRLFRRPDEKGAVNLGYQVCDDIRLGGEWYAASERSDFGKTDHGYALAAFTADWKINSHWRLGARLDNAFDTDYELASGYNTPGRAARVTLSWRE